MANVVNGTAGNDTIGGSIGDDAIDGGAGNDRIFAGPGNDLVSVGDGNDTMSGEAGNDTVLGGAGNDVLYGGGNDDLIEGGLGDDGLVGDGGNDTLDGGAGNDVLLGMAGNDTLIFTVGQGAERLEGGTGADTVVIRLTKADLTPAVRADLAQLNAFMDAQLAGAGSATALAGQATGSSLQLTALGLQLSTVEAVAVELDGKPVPLASLLNEAPVMAPTAALEALEDGSVTGLAKAVDGDGDALTFSVAGAAGHGTVGVDAVTGAYTYTPTAGWSGTDTFRLAVTDWKGATALQDVTVSVAAVADAPSLEVANRQLSVATDAGQTIKGGKGDDVLAGGLGGDTINGGSGNDVITTNTGKLVSLPLDLTAALADLDGSETLGLTIGGVPAGAHLTAGHDNGDGTWTLAAGDLDGLALTGRVTDSFDLAVTATATEASGGTASITTAIHVDVAVGNDTVSGGNGDDHITGGSGNDVLLGGRGDDSLEGGAGNDLVNGNSGDDVLSDGLGADTVLGGSGNDHVLAGLGDDKYVGGSGFDTLDFSNVTGSMTIDISKKTATGAGNDTFSGFERIVGSAHDDVFKGSSKADIINGGAGDDVIRGLGGADVMTGGEGDDTFVWLAKDVLSGKSHLGLDHITDFGAGDRLDLHDLLKGFKGAALADAVQVTDTKQGSMVSVRMGDKMVDVVHLDNVHGLDASHMLADGMILA